MPSGVLDNDESLSEAYEEIEDEENVPYYEAETPENDQLDRIADGEALEGDTINLAAVETVETTKVVNGHAGGEHANHAENGEVDEDCDECIAEQEEVTHTMEAMILLVGVSLTLLLVWLMMRRCKTGEEERQNKKPKQA